MIDISKYTSKTTIKKELNYVYVHDIGEHRYAVATDSFRLARVHLTSVLSQRVKTGYYTAKAWKEVTKILKKNDVAKANDLIEIVNKEMLNDKDMTFPKYEKILPKFDDENEDYTFKGTSTINGIFLIDLIKDTQNHLKQFDFSKIKENNHMISYDYDGSIILIMKMNKK